MLTITLIIWFMPPRVFITCSWRIVFFWDCSEKCPDPGDEAKLSTIFSTSPPKTVFAKFSIQKYTGSRVSVGES